MKIIYGITKANFGGAQRYVFELATEAKKLGHDVKVVCGQKGVLTEKLSQSGIEVIQVERMERDVKLFSEIPVGIEVMRILNKERPDVFHINSTKMGGTGGFAVFLMNMYWRLRLDKQRTKAVFTSHAWAFNETWRPTWQIALIKFFSWWTVIQSHITICVSEKTRQDVVDWPFVKSRLGVVHNGLKEFELLPRAQARRELGIHEEDLLHVGTIGELHKVKGQDVLLRAWPKFAQGRHAQLTIIGGGEEQESLEKLVDELGISNSVRFAGFVNDARQFLHAFDIYVFPSRSENLPYSVLEAGFANLPVVASAVGGIPEIIETGVNGILVPKEHPETILSSLLLLTENPDLGPRLGNALKETVLQNFSLDKMVHETLAVY